LTKYVNDIRDLEAGDTRLYVRHTAATGDVLLRRGRHRRLIRGLESPDQEGADMPVGEWLVRVYPSRARHQPLFSTRLHVMPTTAYFAHAVGTPSKGTFRVLVQTIHGE
jgi:hypothetical protein